MRMKLLLEVLGQCSVLITRHSFRGSVVKLDSTVGTVTRQRAGQPRNLGSIPCRVKRFLCSPKGSFPRGEAAGS